MKPAKKQRTYTDTDSHYRAVVSIDEKTALEIMSHKRSIESYPLVVKDEYGKYYTEP